MRFAGFPASALRGPWKERYRSPLPRLSSFATRRRPVLLRKRASPSKLSSLKCDCRTRCSWIRAPGALMSKAGAKLPRLQKTQPFGHRRRREGIAAFLAGAHRTIGVEGRVDLAHLRGKVALDHGSRQHLFIAALAKPDECFVLIRLSPAFDHEPPGSLPAPRRVGQPARAQENLAFANHHHLPALVLGLEMELDVAVNLIENLLARLDVKVQALVRPVQDHDDKILAVRQDAVGLVGRLEEMPVLFDPALEIGGGKRDHHGSKSIAPRNIPRCIAADRRCHWAHAAPFAPAGIRPSHADPHLPRTRKTGVELSEGANPWSQWRQSCLTERSTEARSAPLRSQPPSW